MDFLHPILALFPGPGGPPGRGLAELAGSPHAILILLGTLMAFLAYSGRRKQDGHYETHLALAFLAVVLREIVLLADVIGRRLAGGPPHGPPHGPPRGPHPEHFAGGPPLGGPPPGPPESLFAVWSEHVLTAILIAAFLQYLMKRDEPGRRYLIASSVALAVLGGAAAMLGATPRGPWPAAMNLAGLVTVIAAFELVRRYRLGRGAFVLRCGMAVFLVRDALTMASFAFLTTPIHLARPAAGALTVAGLIVLGYLFVRERSAAYHTDVDTLQTLVDARTDELRSTLDQLSGMNAVLRAQSTLDSLTGVCNRRRFDEALREEWIRAKEMDEPLAAALIDLDCFKSINDTFGHPAGDQCLVLVADALRSAVRGPTDIVARYGGDEFAILLPGLEADDASRLLEGARKEVESLEGVASALELSFTVSVGVASCRRGDIETADELVRLADRALYCSKTQGRNRVEAKSAPLADAAGT